MFQALFANKLQELFLSCLGGMKGIAIHLELACYFKAAIPFAAVLGTLEEVVCCRQAQVPALPSLG